MPAMNPANTRAGSANPSTGAFVIMGALSGPTGSPFDKDSSNNASTGALSTGIGFGATQIIGPTDTIPQHGFTYHYVPGGPPVGYAGSVPASAFTYIGGGRSSGFTGYGAPTNPYTAGTLICGFGYGCTRDGGAGPSVFTGFTLQMSTATGAVANGAAVETGYLNRSNVALVSGQSVFAQNSTAQVAPA